LIGQLVAFVAVIVWAIAPGAIVPLLRGALILYAFGLTP